MPGVLVIKFTIEDYLYMPNDIPLPGLDYQSQQLEVLFDWMALWLIPAKLIESDKKEYSCGYLAPFVNIAMVASATSIGVATFACYNCHGPISIEISDFEDEIFAQLLQQQNVHINLFTLQKDPNLNIENLQMPTTRASRGKRKSDVSEAINEASRQSNTLICRAIPSRLRRNEERSQQIRKKSLRTLQRLSRQKLPHAKMSSG